MVRPVPPLPLTRAPRGRASMAPRLRARRTHAARCSRRRFAPPMPPAQNKVMGHLQKSAEVMRVMNNLIKLPEIAQTMMSLQKEMVKAGVIEDMVDDVMEQDDEELEDEAEEEVEKVLAEITSDLFEKAGAVPLQSVSAAAAAAAARTAASVPTRHIHCERLKSPQRCHAVRRALRRWPSRRRSSRRRLPAQRRRRRTARKCSPCRRDSRA